MDERSRGIYENILGSSGDRSSIKAGNCDVWRSEELPHLLPVIGTIWIYWGLIFTNAWPSQAQGCHLCRDGGRSQRASNGTRHPQNKKKTHALLGEMLFYSLPNWFQTIILALVLLTQELAKMNLRIIVWNLTVRILWTRTSPYIVLT